MAWHWPAYVVHAAALGYDVYGNYGYGSVCTHHMCIIEDLAELRSLVIISDLTVHESKCSRFLVRVLQHPVLIFEHPQTSQTMRLCQLIM